MEDSSFPNSSADDLKKHVMNVFKEATQDREENTVLKNLFDSIRDYDSLNKYAFQKFTDLVDSGFAEEAKELFKPRNAWGILPHVAVYTIVIGAYGNAGRADNALKVYHQMIATGVAPSSVTYNELITALASYSSSDVNYVEYAKKYYLEMLLKEMKPHPATWSILFYAIACRDSVEKAREFFEHIQSNGFTIDPNVPRIEEDNLIKAMSAMKMCQDVVNNTTDKDVRKVLLNWLNPDSLAMTFKMVGALIDDGNGNEANKLFKHCCKTHMHPKVVVHTCVIEAYLKFGKTQSALEAYRSLLAAEDAPNSYTYTVLIKGLAADPSFIGDAKKCLLEMMDKGMRPNAATYTVVIESFAKRDDKSSEEECKELVDVMISKGFVPNAKAMMEVLKGRPKSVIRGIMNIVLSKLKG